MTAPFSFPDLAPANYRLTGENAGFTRLTIDGLKVDVGATLTQLILRRGLDLPGGRSGIMTPLSAEAAAFFTVTRMTAKSSRNCAWGSVRSTMLAFPFPACRRTAFRPGRWMMCRSLS
jgi:hypothetical protein